MLATPTASRRRSSAFVQHKEQGNRYDVSTFTKSFLNSAELIPNDFVREVDIVARTIVNGLFPVTFESLT